MKKATAIITADIELRDFTPTCRTDDHWKAQSRKIKWLKSLQEKHECIVLDGGDLFDKKYKQHPNHELLVWAMENLPSQFYTVPGNHDLPGKSIKNYKNSAMAVLEQAGIVSGYGEERITLNESKFTLEICRFPWGVDIDPFLPEKLKNRPNTRCIALVHTMVYDGFHPFPGCIGWEKMDLIKKFRNYDLVVCGHNHQTFTAEWRGTVLVNPGSLMRNDADQIDFKPSVFLWYAEDNTIERVFIPIEQGVVSRVHIDEKNEKEHRLDAFVERLGAQATHGVNFEQNLEQYVAEVSKGIQDKVWSYYER